MSPGAIRGRKIDAGGRRPLKGKGEEMSMSSSSSVITERCHCGQFRLSLVLYCKGRLARRSAT